MIGASLEGAIVTLIALITNTLAEVGITHSVVVTIIWAAALLTITANPARLTKTTTIATLSVVVAHQGVAR